MARSKSSSSALLKRAMHLTALGAYRAIARPCINMASQYNTVQRARICVFENEKSTVFVSAAVVATIIARIEGDFSAMLAPDIPVFWLPEQDIAQVLGEASWDAVVHRLGYSLVGISFVDWTEEKLLATLRQIFPTAELQSINEHELNEK